MALGLFGKKKCPVCSGKMTEPFGEIRLETAEGVHAVEVCSGCSNFFDKSAEAMLRNKDTNNAESI